MSNALQLATYTLEGGQVLSATTVKNYIAPGATDQEVLYFIELCKSTNKSTGISMLSSDIEHISSNFISAFDSI